MKKFFSRLLFTYTLFPASAAHAQACCTTGSSSLGGMERGASGANELRVGIAYHYNDVSNAYEGSKRIPDPLQRSASVELLAVEIEYGLVEHVSLLGQIGYHNRKRSIAVRSASGEDEERATFNGFGVGDLLLMAKYQLLRPSLISPWEISVGGGAKLPVGEYRQELDGSTLSLDLQAGSGASDLIAWGYLGYHLRSRGLTFTAAAFHRYPGVNLENYRYGDETLLQVGVAKQVTEYMELSVAAKSRFAQRDFSNGRLLQSTGGKQFSIQPNLMYHGKTSVFRLFGILPLASSMNGIQLSLTYALGVELTYVLDVSEKNP